MSEKMNFIISPLVSKARLYAKEKHEGQLRDGGSDYYHDHLVVVGRILLEAGCSEEVVAAGYLHDVIEDTEVTYEELKKEFGSVVADLVHEVTHEGEADHIGYYFPRLHSREGILIKLADRMANINDMDSWSKERQEHYLKKTKFWKADKDE